MIIIFKSYYEISNTIFLIIALLKLLLKKLDGALNKYNFFNNSFIKAIIKKIRWGFKQIQFF